MYIHGDFINKLGQTVAVHILTDGDRTEEREIGTDEAGLYFPAEDPVTIDDETNDTFDHLLRHSATITLLAADYQPELFCTSCRQAVVNIFRDDTCLFAGFIEPMTYSQGYNDTYDELELNCIDALSALQYSKYREIGSLGVLYSAVKASAAQRTFYDIITEILSGATASLDITGGHSVAFLYDGSKAINNLAANRYAIFANLAISELLFLGDEEDDTWQQDEVVEEILRFLNLHIVQDGFCFYIFAWETVKADSTIHWTDIVTGSQPYTERQTIDITADIAADTDTTISIGETYNQLLLTCNIESMENLIESPLDTDLLVSPYANRQKYITEYTSWGTGTSALSAFDAMTHDRTTGYDGGDMTDWYVQVRDNPHWLFPDKGEGNLIEKYCDGKTNQQTLPNLFAKQQAAALFALGKVETKTSKTDNSIVSKVDMTDYLVVSVNGNENDTEADTYPNAASLKEGCPCAVYNGSVSGGVLSPSDDQTVNYIVLSGKIVLNPIMKLTDNFKALYNYKPDEGGTAGMGDGIYQWAGCTVQADNGPRYYTQRWWKADTPNAEEEWDKATLHGFVPYTGEAAKAYEFQYSAIGDGTDTVSKVAVLACMLIIGDKCVVEKGTAGQISDFEWRTYKTLEECDSEDEYYQQSFTIGFDPKIGDKLIGTEFDFQNNISYKLGIDAEGIAIPIRHDTKVNGAVKFVILGPVYSLWSDITRRHPTFFRHTKWGTNTVPLMAHVSSIFIKEFEVKIYSDNGLVNNTGDSDIVYMSDTRETFVNKKDDLEFKISSALTTAESRQLGVTDSVKMSTPINTASNEGLLYIYDYARQTTAKAEQLYVDSYYNEYHAPRIEMTQNLTDSDGTTVGLFAHYRHPCMDKTFFVQGIGRNLMEGYAELTLKEIDE